MPARFSKKQKDHETLIKAMKLLHDHHPLCKLLLAGGGKIKDRHKMETICKNLGLKDQVQFLGTRNDIPDLMRNSQIIALSTHYEGLGIVLLEGMASGCIVLGTNISPINEMIADGKNGYLIPAKNPEAWAKKIKFMSF
jgi:glycosyltransferase involved in cell wall biosynthesis